MADKSTWPIDRHGRYIIRAIKAKSGQTGETIQIKVASEIKVV